MGGLLVCRQCRKGRETSVIFELRVVILLAETVFVTTTHSYLFSLAFSFLLFHPFVFVFFLFFLLFPFDLPAPSKPRRGAPREVSSRFRRRLRAT